MVNVPQSPTDDLIGPLAPSARGWHGVQLAALAFIGLCGVLSEPDPELPEALQVTAAVLALVALVLACVAIGIVAGVAWPLSTEPPTPAQAAAARRRLRVGVGLTFVAVAAMALAASAGWWPVDEQAGGAGEGGAVVLTDLGGRTACGTLVEAPAGRVGLETDDGSVEIELDDLSMVAPVDGC